MPNLQPATTDPNNLVFDHSVTVNPFTGGAQMSVPLALTAGRESFGPRFSLDYSSAAANSPYGVGWSLGGILAVYINTRKRLPRYDGTDDYTFSAGGEAVPVPGAVDAGAYRVRYYRSRVEQSFIRLERWTETATGRIHWRSRDARNVVVIYGLRADNSTRIFDPDDPSRTFTWLPEATYDAKGNCIRYEYLAEDRAQVISSPYERAKSAAIAQRYLKRALYGNTLAMAPDAADPAGNRWAFQVVLDYGDHNLSPTPDPDHSWPVRQDIFSTFRAGFEIRTYRLCRRILQFHDFAALSPDPALTASWTMAFDERPEGSTVTSFTYTGFRTDPATQQVTSRAMPPLVMTYSVPSVASGFTAAPQAALENVPYGFFGAKYRWVDLYGEGLPGLLTESGSSWLYSANRGGGEFAAQQVVANRPAISLAHCVLDDVSADGNTSVAVLTGRTSGYYEFDRDSGEWSGFKPFPSMPHLEATANAQWLDFNGDGRSDLVLSGPGQVLWFPSEGRDGFGAPVENACPQALAPLEQNLALDYFLADMTGDGLPDQVLIRNGRVEYWPQLGNGQFGDPVLMEDAPMFAPEGEFDASRVILIDLDGTGGADIVYLGNGEIRYWYNAYGNKLIEGGRIPNLPYIDNGGAARVLDLLGDGTPCLVWSSTQVTSGAPVQYLPLMNGVKPRLLLAVNNSMGLETHLEYSTSAEHYLRDQRAGRPWSTRLPSHPMVVNRQEVIDAITGSSSATRFEYHDGFFDGEERSFGGFGAVDQYDADVPAPGDTDPEIVLTTPTRMRTWFHTGNPLNAALPDAWSGDAKQALLPYLVFEDPAGIGSEDYHEAWRSVAGRMIRQEIFAASGADPFQVVESSYRVRRVQARIGDEYPSHAAFLSERLTFQYEQHAADPRIQHELTLSADDYLNPTTECNIFYPRRNAIAAAHPAQRATLVSCSTRRFLNIDNAARHELSIPVETRSFEISGLVPQPDGVLPWETVQAAIQGPLAGPIAFDQAFGAGVQARLNRWSRTCYWNDAQTGALPLAQTGAIALLHHVESACFTPAWAAATWGGHVDDAMLQNDGGYLLADGYWWKTGEVFLWSAAAAFYQLAGARRADGGTVTIGLDADQVIATQIRDALGNVTAAEIDYNLMLPWRVTDANNNVNESLFDPLGVAIVSSVHGQILDAAGNPQSYGDDPLATYHPAAATFDTVIANPGNFVQNASVYTYYELDSWTVNAIPPRAIKLLREIHVHDGTGAVPAASPIRIGVTHSGGLRNILQTKVNVEPGPALERDGAGHLVLDGHGKPVEGPPGPRWLSNGHTILNRKQEPVRQYEPYFSVTPQYEPEDAIAHFGVYRQCQYDAIGRETRQDMANGTLSRLEYDAWETRAFDPNDTVLDSTYKTLRDALPANDPEKKALRKAEAHANTPAKSQADPAGAEIQRVRSAAPGDDRTVQTVRDINGRPIAIIDERGLNAFKHQLDMTGRALATTSMDAGATVTLLDIYDRPVHQWDARGVHLQRTFDQLDRAVALHVDGALGLNQTIQQTVYGEDPAIANAQLRNLRGRPAIVRDSSGAVTIDCVDYEGRPLRLNRRLLTDYTKEPDWDHAPALDAEILSTANSLDALGRTIMQTLPDGVTRKYTFAAGGGLAKAVLSSADGKLAHFPVLASADFNARGERTSMALGNGVTVTRVFDSETFLVNRLTATRGAAALLDLRYTYDPSGNIVYAVDQAQMPAAPGGFLQGLNVTPESEYTYDALYQLTQATGRVHQALLQNDYVPGAAGTTKGTRHLTFNNGAAVERYTRNYAYDKAGNLQSVAHNGTTQNWNTAMWISATSNRSLTALDLAGNPVANPEDQFDAAGNCTYLPFLRSTSWTYDGQIANAVMIDRSAAAQPNDVEYYVYDGAGIRTRKVTERLVAGQVEATDVIYLEGCEIKRIRHGGFGVLERFTTHASDGLNRIALVHRWTLDAGALETNDITKARARFQLTNHLGSSLIELDELAAVTSYEEYFPFGGSSFLAGDSAIEAGMRGYRFSGKERDDSTGLYYFGHRYYASWLGRWMSPDPLGPEDGVNLYLYVHNNPICMFDPSGLQTKQAQTSRGKTVTVRGSSAPQAVIDAFKALSPERQAAFRRGELVWYLNVEMGVVDFISPEEAKKIQEKELSQGKNVGQFKVSPKPKPKVQKKVEEITFEDDHITAKQGDDVSIDKDGGDSGGDGATGPPPKKAGDGQGSGKNPGGAENGDNGTGGTGAQGANGDPAGSTGTGNGSDPGNTGSHSGDGSSTKDTPPGGGAGPNGPGPGLGLTGNGTGGGGTDPKGTPGAQGGTGTGRGTGTQGLGTGADGTGTGGDGTADQPGNGAPGGDGTGSGENGFPGGVPGGTGTTPGGHGQTPGGAGTVPGANGSNAGGGGGDPNLPASDGKVPAPPGQTVNGTSDRGGLQGSPNGKSENGSRDGTGNSNNSNGQGSNQAQSGQGTNTDPQGHGNGDANGHVPPPPNRTWGDKVIKYFGYLNLEFGDGDPENGQSGGIPGGHGSHNWGGWGQALYAVVSVIGVILMFTGAGEIKAFFSSLKAGFKAALTGVAKLFTREFWETAGKKIGTWLAEDAAKAVRGKFSEWLAYWGDKGGETIGQQIGSKWWPRFNTAVINYDIKGTWGFLDTAAHEGFHAFVGRYLGFIWKAGDLELLKIPIGAPVKYLEEVAAYSIGRIASLRLPAVLLAPLHAFGSLTARETAVVVTLQVGGAAYAAYHYLAGDKTPAPQPQPATP